MIKLNLGSGIDYRPGWINVDCYYNGKIDVNNDIIILNSFADESANHILASHVLEHLGQSQGLRAVHRWYKVLTPGGTIEIIVPNFPLMARMWIDEYDKTGDAWGFNSSAIWGNQDNEGQYHKWGYDETTLRCILEKLKFIDVNIELIDGKWENDGTVKNGNIRATARKPE